MRFTCAKPSATCTSVKVTPRPRARRGTLRAGRGGPCPQRRSLGGKRHTKRRWDAGPNKSGFWEGSQTSQKVTSPERWAPHNSAFRAHLRRGRRAEGRLRPRRPGSESPPHPPVMPAARVWMCVPHPQFTSPNSQAQRPSRGRRVLPREPRPRGWSPWEGLRALVEELPARGDPPAACDLAEGPRPAVLAPWPPSAQPPGLWQVNSRRGQATPAGVCRSGSPGGLHVKEEPWFDFMLIWEVITPPLSGNPWTRPACSFPRLLPLLGFEKNKAFVLDNEEQTSGRRRDWGASWVEGNVWVKTNGEWGCAFLALPTLLGPSLSPFLVTH